LPFLILADFIILMIIFVKWHDELSGEDVQMC
jgi:hypothetical protein